MNTSTEDKIKMTVIWNRFKAIAEKEAIVNLLKIEQLNELENIVALIDDHYIKHQ